MTRREINGQVDRDALKKEIKSELRAEAARRKVAGYGTCAVLALVALLVPVLLVASVMAKTGLVNVPLLTSRLYKPSSPTRTVVPLVGYGPQDVMSAAMAGAAYNMEVNEVKVEIDEQQLTTLVAHDITAAQGPGGAPFTIASPQIVITPQDMEFFGYAVRGERKGTVLLRFVPHLKNGALTLAPTEMRLGALTVPNFLASMVLDRLSSSLNGGLRQSLQTLGSLSSIQLGDGKVTVGITPNK